MATATSLTGRTPESSASGSARLPFPEAPALLIVSVMDSVFLPPDLEQFAAAAIAAGRYRDVGEVVAAGVGLLRRAEAQREDLLASVMAAEAQAERDGFLTIDEVMLDADTLIEEMAGTRR